MPKYIHEKLWMTELETRLREVLGEYNENIWKFEVKKNKAAGVRARHNLLELFHLCRARRKEILEDKRHMGWTLHPSWEGIEDED